MPAIFTFNYIKNINKILKKYYQNLNDCGIIFHVIIKKEELTMSGHSKWHNIAAKKGKADAARGKIFTKLGRELLIAVKEGGPDPAGNSKLKDVIAKCKANNMPNDTINNAIKKASGAGNNENYEEIIYEGYGANGVAVIVEASTDNKIEQQQMYVMLLIKQEVI